MKEKLKEIPKVYKALDSKYIEFKDNEGNIIPKEEYTKVVAYGHHLGEYGIHHLDVVFIKEGDKSGKLLLLGGLKIRRSEGKFEDLEEISKKFPRHNFQISKFPVWIYEAYDENDNKFFDICYEEDIKGSVKYSFSGLCG